MGNSKPKSRPSFYAMYLLFLLICEDKMEGLLMLKLEI
jgi:hypothetical protein